MEYQQVEYVDESLPHYFYVGVDDVIAELAAGQRTFAPAAGYPVCAKPVGLKVAERCLGDRLPGSVPLLVAACPGTSCDTNCR
jgi:hypothetical protein